MKRLGTSFGSAEPQEPYPLPSSLFEPYNYNLNHVSVFLLTLCLSCLPSGQPVLAYPSPTYLVGLSTYVIKSF